MLCVTNMGLHRLDVQPHMLIYFLEGALRLVYKVGALYTSSDLVAVWSRALGSQRKSNRKSDRKFLT